MKQVLTQEPPVETGLVDNSAHRPTITHRYALIVIGIPGDEEHEARFRSTADRWRTWLIEHAGCTEETVTLLVGRDETDSTLPATKKSIREVSTRLCASLKENDALWVFLLGHGSRDKRHGYLHLPGPDLNSTQWAGLFAELNAGEQVFWLTNSGSGAFLKAMSLPGRIVMTATDPEEVNETRFPHLLADVMERSAIGSKQKLSNTSKSDRSKRKAEDGQFETTSPESPAPAQSISEDSLDEAEQNGSDAIAEPSEDDQLIVPVTVLGLFRETSMLVGKAFEKEELAPTEHAQIDDNGDGKGTELVDLEQTSPVGDPASIDGVLSGATPTILESNSVDKKPIDQKPNPPSEPKS